MNTILTSGLLLASAFMTQATFADSPWKITIGSFIQVGDSRSRLGELCGHVDGPKEFFRDTRVRVAADYNSKRPGIYNVSIDSAGKFCTLLHTYYGTAEATLWVPEGAPPAEVLKTSAAF